MNITFDEAKDVSYQIIEGKLSFEDASRWAYSKMRALELKELTFVPRVDEEIIWEAVMFLYGIDNQIAPGEYLHSKDQLASKIHDLEQSIKR